jgi:hypothetical protein
MQSYEHGMLTATCNARTDVRIGNGPGCGGVRRLWCPPDFHVNTYLGGMAEGINGALLANQ